VVALASAPDGFTVTDLAQGVRQRMEWSPEKYSTRRAVYDLAKIRGKGLFERIRESRYLLRNAFVFIQLICSSQRVRIEIPV